MLSLNEGALVQQTNAVALIGKIVEVVEEVEPGRVVSAGVDGVE